jgi:hypothetical protein
MSQDRPRSGLEEFRAVIADYKSIGPWAMGGTVFVPLVDYVLRLGPPWPDGLAILTCVAELLMLMAVFHFGFGSTREHVSRRMIVLVLLMVICFGVYLYLGSMFIFTAPGDERFIRGFTLRPEVQAVIGQNYSVEDALNGYEYRADAIWTKGSITAMRLILLSLWLLSFSFLSGTIASFVIYHRRRPARKKMAL